MTNNLKILTILSIFILILTGYFCFSSSFTKNQIITNNNKDNKEITNINNEDSNNNEEKASKLSILDIIILIVIVGVIIFIIIKFKSKYAESKEDFAFAKEKFCPTFFLINPSSLEGEDKDNVQEDGEYFFKILAKYILSKFSKNTIDNIKKVKISLDTIISPLIVDNVYTISFKEILEEIAKFAAFTKNIKNEDIDKIVKPLKIGASSIEFYTVTNNYVTRLEQKYGEEFDSYLCSYILYYLVEEIAKKMINVKFHRPENKNSTTNFKCIIKFDDNNSINVLKEYSINYDIIEKILDKLLNDKPLKNVEYTKSVVI